MGRLGVVKIIWLVRKKGLKCWLWNVFSFRVWLLGVDYSFTGFMVSFIKFRLFVKVIIIAIDIIRMVIGYEVIYVF